MAYKCANQRAIHVQSTSSYCRRPSVCKVDESR